MSLPKPLPVSNDQVGSWEIWAYPSGLLGEPLNVTFVRNAPTSIVSMETTDPFGPETAELVFPAVSMLDSIGTGDLWWLRPGTDIDICYMPPAGDTPLDVWEGYMLPFSWEPTEAGSQVHVTLVGAMRQVDNYLAKPEYVYQPLTYEAAIARQFTSRPDLRLAALTVEWPDWWTTRWALDPTKPLYLRPQGLEEGQLWSGLVTRATGSFDQALSGYVQGLLASMFSDSGQFTLALDVGRKPVLRHRARKTAPDATTLVVDILQPGVKLSPAQDYSQSANVIYGQGKALNGATFSGMRASADGSRVTYEPMAYRNQVHPIEQNAWYDPSVMRKEINLAFYEGINEADGRVIARQHMQRVSDPGTTATLELSTDPTQDGMFFPRRLIKAGMSIQVTGLFGSPDGVLFHVVSCKVEAKSTTLTLDSKHRDYLTVSEVRARTRDALAPVRLLTVGQYRPAIPDMLFPWSYPDGSGFLPKAALSLFQGAPSDLGFPWESWTRQRPPSDPLWRDSYVRIGPASDNADQNWAARDGSLANPAFPIRMSQAGEARLIQVAAFDSNGNLMRVPFHVSFYRTNGVSYTAMPMLGDADVAEIGQYAAGEHYPFFRRAWEQIDENGVTLNPETGRAVTTAQILMGYGNFYERAGYWPTSSAIAGTNPTGLLVDEQGFSWDLTDAVYGVDPQRSAAENAGDPNRADIWCMIYCDAQAEQEVFFLGRIWRKEPGTA